MNEKFKLLITLSTLLISFNQSVLQARVIEEGAVWEQLLLATDLPKAPPLSSTVWPNPTANFGLEMEGIAVDQEGVIYMDDATVMSVFPTNNPGGLLWRYDPMTKAVTRFLQPEGIAFGVHFDKNDLILGCSADSPNGGRAVRRYDTKTGAFIVLATDYPAGSGNLLVNPRYVTVDHKGRIYFSDSRVTVPNTAGNTYTLPFAVYRIDTDGSLHQIITNLARPNAIEISPDGKKLYVGVGAAPNYAPNSFSPLAAQQTDVWGYSLNIPNTVGLLGGYVAVYDLNDKGEIVDSKGNVSPENSNTTAGSVFISRTNLIAANTAMDIDGNIYVAWNNGGFPGAGLINGWLGEITVSDSSGNQIDNLTPELANVPPIAGIPAPVLTPQKQIQNFRPIEMGFGKGKTKHILYLGRGEPWGLYSIPTKKIGFS